MKPKTNILRPIFVFATLALCTWALYAQTLNSPFLFDDFFYIQDNPHIHLNQLDGASFAFIFEGPAWNRPLPMLSFALTYNFFGLDVQPYHVFNLVLHIATAFVLFLCLQSILRIAAKNSWLDPCLERNIFAIAFFCALLWCIHPLHTQTVNYLSQRMNGMAAFFFILSVYAYLKARTSPKHTAVFIVLCITSALAALGSKQNAATLPCIVFIFEWLFFQKADWAWLRRKIPYLLMAMVLVVSIIAMFTKPEEHRFLEHFDGSKLLTQLRVNAHYLSLLCFPKPSRRVFDYDYALSTSLFEPWTTFASLIMFVILGALILAYLRRYPLVAFCFLWYFSNLIIESTYVVFEVIFEYRTYLPSMLFFVPFALGGMHVAHKCRLKRWSLWALILIPLSTSALWTYERNEVWRDDITFWQDNVKKSPEKARVWNHLGLAYARIHQHRKAMDHYHKAIDLDPNYANPYTNIATSLLHLREFEHAIAFFKKAITLESDPYLPTLGLADTYNILQRNEKALALYNVCAQAKPRDKNMLNNRGLCQSRLGLWEAAEQSLRNALNIDPNYTDAYFNLGLLYKQQGRYTESLACFEQAIKLQPGLNTAQEHIRELRQKIRP